MSRFVVLLALLSGVLATPTPSLLVQHSQNQVDKTPFAAGCFMWLITAFALTGVVMYAWNTFNKRLENMPGMDEKKQAILAKIFAEETLRSALDALSTAPVVCLLILFLALRARAELFDEESSAYTTCEFGMGAATVGLLLLALDTMTVRIESLVFGNISIPLGNSLVAIGYLLLLVSCFTTKSAGYDWSTHSICFVALAILHVGLAFEAKLIHAIQLLAPENVHEMTSTVLNAELVQKVRDSSNFAPMAMTVLFYFHFYPWASKHEHPDITNDLAVCLTLAIFVNAFAVTADVFGSDTVSSAVKGVKLAAVILMYATFFGLMYCLVIAESPSVATCNAELLLIVVATLNLVKVAMREGIDKLALESGSMNQTLALVKDMINAGSSVQLICVLFLFVHFRAELFLAVPVQDHIDDFSYLSPAIHVTTVSVLVQMLAFIVGAVSESGLDSYILAAGVGFQNLGVLLVVLAMVV